ncbi:MAG TPA: ABC transporter substrate-binding protein [Pyrinomonadaceae bacterium]|jgi:ABC-type branched-subunit amino acid transport system substrate-binding protein|nr:ABC transporter substrate-binding protein [Pyrinomonadaceae bacterium]
MSFRSIKLFIILAVVLAAIWLGLDGRGSAAASPTPGRLTPAEQRGKKIYLKGEDEGGEITALLGGSDTEVPASTFACVTCHGLKGEGTNEGGLQAPTLVWSALAAPATSALTRQERAAYTEATLVRALRVGLDASRGRLHPGMPRYRISDEQAANLVAYLKKLGREVEPGVSETTIKVGAALPMSGALAQVGEDIKATISASFAEANERGDIYGRRFELVVEDSRGDLEGTRAATRTLIERDGVFALAGSYEPREGIAADEFLRQSEVPLVGPVTLSPHLTMPPNRFVFYLLPTFDEQARSLVDFIVAQSPSAPNAPNERASVEPARGKDRQSATVARKARAAVIHVNGTLETGALVSLQAQARLRSLQIVSEQSYEAGRFNPARAVETLARTRPEYVFFFGGAADIVACAREMERAGLKTSLVSSVMMLGGGAFELPPSVAARTFLSYPSALPNQEDFAEFLSVMQRRGVPLRSPAFQTIAYAAAKTLIEATKLSSRELSRHTLIDALEGLRGYRTGVVPPLSFSPNRRVGVEGSYVVGIDLVNKRYTALSEQIIPRDNN